MRVLWEHGGSLTAAQVIERLAADDTEKGGGGSRGWAPQTVKTLLSRLCAKKAVVFAAKGKTYEYRAAVARDELSRAESRSFLSRVFGSQHAVSLMLAQLIDDDAAGGTGSGGGAGMGQGLTREEIEACRRLLDQAEQQQRDARSGKEDRP
jgi:predicted transcriptional regulator